MHHKGPNGVCKNIVGSASGQGPVGFHQKRLVAPLCGSWALNILATYIYCYSIDDTANTWMNCTNLFKCHF